MFGWVGNALGFMKRLFVKPDGGINWRSVLLIGGGAILGGATVGAAAGVGIGLVGATGLELIAPSGGAAQDAAPQQPLIPGLDTNNLTGQALNLGKDMLHPMVEQVKAPIIQAITGKTPGNGR